MKKLLFILTLILIHFSCSTLQRQKKSDEKYIKEYTKRFVDSVFENDKEFKYLFENVRFEIVYDTIKKN